MKLMLVSLIIVLLFQACGSSPLTQNQSEKVFDYKIDLLKTEIKQRLILFTNEKFISSKAVIQTNEDGLFSGNGIVQLERSLPIINMELTFIVKYSDNNYKVKWIVKNLMVNNESMSQSVWGYYYEDIEESINKNNELLFDYLNNYENNF